ncbi:uroporphyrinogen decarboxylase [Longimonas halophila]|uniref:Uroporphyrinogen decarboxylase n=1 Tax=Longimonas halophila TaxID=1469170 RepID=A0A2H3NI92_9BACT|nr:uroporphyrinogen decarboxylase [Longimonas halophila]PEN05065.1 uroporphyrinogen decarboxylase [Longimonas halophila]
MANFPPLQNDLFLRVARGDATERTPVWMMRQAGRYLPEYQAVRADHPFFEVVNTPELAAEVTLQPIDRFPLDAAIIFSDILVIPQALGLEVQMVSGKGPHFPNPLDTPADLERVTDQEANAVLQPVYDALTHTRHELNGRVPLIGFAGAPWTLMAYMIEGGGSKSYRNARRWLYQHPESSHELLNTLATLIGQYLIKQVDAGAQALQVFDSWAGLLGPSLYRTFGIPYLESIVRTVKEAHPDVPCIAFAKGAPYAQPALAAAGYDALSLDWTMSPETIRAEIDTDIVLQGNLDPCALYSAPDDIRRQVQHMLAAFGPQHHIANLGHGMHPDHDPDHAGVFIEAVHAFSETMRAV